MRVVHLADLHLGFNHLTRTTPSGQNQREADFEQAALLAADWCVTQQPDLVIIAGDLLHKTTPSITGIEGASEFCARLANAGLPTVVIGGNHDEAESEGRFNTLRYLQRYGITLFLEQTHYDIAGVRLHVVPYRVISRAHRGRGQLQEFDIARDRPNILVAHGYTPGQGVPELPTGAETEIPADWIRDPRFALVCLGHIHHATELAPHAFYAGALERRDFGEQLERPSFFVHTVDQQLMASERIFIDQLGPAPRPMERWDIDTSHLTVQELNKQVLERLESNDVTGMMLRLVLLNVSAELDRSRARSVWDRVFRERGGFYLEAVTQTRRVVELLDVEFAAPPVDLADAFQQFLAEQHYSSDDERQATLDLGAEIMADAHADILRQEGG